MILTLLAAVAQEESRAVGNCKWRIRSRFKKNCDWSTPLHVRLPMLGKITIAPEEAAWSPGSLMPTSTAWAGEAIAAALGQQDTPPSWAGAWTRQPRHHACSKQVCQERAPAKRYADTSPRNRCATRASCRGIMPSARTPGLSPGT